MRMRITDTCLYNNYTDNYMTTPHIQVKNSALEFLYTGLLNVNVLWALSYRTRSKDSSTLNFVRRKNSVQVDSNCDEFPVSPIPVIRL